MKDSWKTVRIFISSTFKDMQAERDYLVRFVFPRLREELIKYRIQLVDVDLRWGVTSDQDAYDVCMEEIDNCKPRFICMLGGRYGWIPPDNDISITASEVEYGALDKLEEPIFRYFYFRDPQITESIPDEVAEDYREAAGSKSEKLLESLKERIMNPQTKGKVLVEPDKVECKQLLYFIYPCKWDNNLKRIVGLESFGNKVYDCIMKSIESEFGKHKIEPLNEFEEEKTAMDTFIEDKTGDYVTGSRKNIIEELVNFANGNSGKDYVILYGDPGSGKTALLAEFYRKYTEKYPEKMIISHFVGASAKSADTESILRRFYYELAKSIDYDEEIPNEFHKLKKKFNSLLNEFNDEKSVIILIDAINQLKPSNKFDLGWLPKNMPVNVYFIISTLPGAVLELLENLQLKYNKIKLPVLENDDSEIIIDNFLRRYRKNFDSEQKAVLMNKEDSNNPLYLLAALEEIRTLGTYEEITDRIRELPEKVCPLFQWILKRLEQDQGFIDSDGELIGEKLVTEFVSSIAISRNGLSQKELIGLIEPGDTHGNVAALQRLLRPHLMYKGDLIDFYHEQLLEAVKSTYLNSEFKFVESNKRLGNYFLREANYLKDNYPKGKTPRGFTELLYHLRMAKMWKELLSCLQDSSLFKRIPTGEYELGISRDDQGTLQIGTRATDPLQTDSILDIPLKDRLDIGFAIADVFAEHAWSLIRKTRTFEKPWPETASKLRDYDRLGFLDYRDTFYFSTEFAGKAAEFAIATFKNSEYGKKKLKEFKEKNRGLHSWLHYLYHFGKDETGLSGGLEDNHAGPALESWDKVYELPKD